MRKKIVAVETGKWLKNAEQTEELLNELIS